MCSLYIVEGHSFIMSNNMGWELRSQVTCRSINIIYYLKCNMCKKKETYIGKNVGDNTVELKSKMSQHISDSRTGVSIVVWKTNAYQTNHFLKLTPWWNWISRNQLETYENYFHRKSSDTLNSPEHLKNNNVNLMSYSYILKYFSMKSYCDITPWIAMRKA